MNRLAARQPMDRPPSLADEELALVFEVTPMTADEIALVFPAGRVADEDLRRLA